MSNSEPTSDPRDDQNVGKTAAGSATARFGVALILLSGVFWFSLFAIPFLPLSLGQKSALAGADFVAVQIAWWAGAVLAGPELVARLKSRFKRKTSDNQQRAS